VEDTELKRICGTGNHSKGVLGSYPGTLIMEPKLVHDAGMTGHIEDVVVDAALRKKGIGKVQSQTNFFSS
jgi:hypothetical protein